MALRIKPLSMQCDVRHDHAAGAHVIRLILAVKILTDR